MIQGRAYTRKGTKSFSNICRFVNSAIGLVENLFEEVWIVDMDFIGVDADHGACTSKEKDKD